MRWLIRNRMAGFLPARLAGPAVEAGDLTLVEEVPTFAYPAYVCWRRDLDAPLAAEVVLNLKETVSRNL